VYKRILQKTMKEVDIERRHEHVEVSIAYHRFCFGRLVLYVMVGAISIDDDNSSYSLHYRGDYELTQKTTMSCQLKFSSRINKGVISYVS